MSTENQPAETADIWAALASDPVFGDPNHKPEETKPEDATNVDVVDPPPAEDKPETKEETVAEDKTETNTEAATETNTETKEDAPADELVVTLDDIKDVIPTHPENSLKHYAQQLGVEIEEESIDAFKAKFVTKEQAAEQAKITKEALFAELNPEVAAALEMKQLGVPDHLIHNPTKEIEGYLAMEDAELVRADKNATEGWTSEMIDTEIESLIESGKLGHEASKIRVDLNLQKNAILSQRTDIIQKYTAQQQQVALQKEQLERTQTTEALSKVSEFMGVKIPKEVKDAFITKYNNGVYDKELSSAESRASYILKKELGDKIAKHIQNKASEKAKQAVTDKLLNIPPVKPTSGSRASLPAEKDELSAFDDFG